VTDLGTAASTAHTYKDFVPGVELARLFYAEAVRPVLDEVAPGLPHDAALLGPGSEVLGLDTPRSTDHAWGPRLQLFLPPDRWHFRDELTDRLAERLPITFRGHPTRFVANEEVTPMPAPDGSGRHRVEVLDLGAWLHARLGFDPRPGPGALDWLATPSQLLAEVTGGAVFHDGTGELTAARSSLTWYPDDVWLYLMACQWGRIAQEEPFIGRSGELGDDVGGAVLAARLVRDLMRLFLLQHKVYAPYSKWLGSAVRRLPDGERIGATLGAVLSAGGSGPREENLGRAYGLAAAHHNALGVTDPVDGSPRRFHDRPYRVLDADRFAGALRARIADPVVRALPRIGGVDQFVDSTDVLAHPRRARACALALLAP
jgi:hypothetical protein